MSADAPENQNTPQLQIDTQPQQSDNMLVDIAKRDGFINISELSVGTAEIVGHTVDVSRLAVNGLRMSISSIRERRAIRRAAELDERLRRREHITQTAYAGTIQVDGMEPASRKERKTALKASKRANKVVAAKMRQLRTASYGITDPSGNRIRVPDIDTDGSIKTVTKKYTWTNPDGSKGGVEKEEFKMVPAPSDAGTDAQRERISRPGYSSERRRSERKAHRKHIKESRLQLEVGSKQSDSAANKDREGRKLNRRMRRNRRTVVRTRAKQRKIQNSQRNIETRVQRRLDGREVRLESVRERRRIRREKQRDRAIRETMSGF